MPPATDQDRSAATREEAALWLSRRQSGAWTVDDGRRLDAWLADDPAHRREFERLRALWAAVGDLADSPVVRAERAAPVRRRAGWRPALAAACLAAVAVGLFRLMPGELGGSLRSATTGFGERREIALADGSRIHLDADSAVTIQESGDRQRIVLERGEAFFVVAHRPERRFEVEAGPGRIVDIGTRFGVRRAAERVTVGVAEGEVEVATGGGPPRRLIAGQGMVVSADGYLDQAFPWDADAAFAWREGRLVFERASLADVAAQANRYRREPLVVAEPALAGLRVSGVFRIDDAGGLVWALEQTLPLRAVARNGRIELVSRPAGERETPPVPIR